MGVRPAPIGAIIKMWKLERNSIYTDLRITPLFYGRFYDDLSSITSNCRRAQLMCTLIEDEDPDHLIKLTVDYPETKDHYTPFLNMEVKVDQDGSLNTRLYRKPQKKLLTLNAESSYISFSERAPSVVCTKQLPVSRQTALTPLILRG